MIRLVLVGVLLSATTNVSGRTGNHIPHLANCSYTWYDVDYDPPSPKSLDDLPPAVREKLNAHLTQRLGADYVSKLKLAGGQIVDRGELRAKVPQSVDFKWRPPKYSLHFNIPVGTAASGFCASVDLDDDGTIMEPIGLPRLSVRPERGRFVPATEASLVAKRNGVPIDQASCSLYYFPDTDTLEYEFQFVKHDDGLNIVYSLFHVVAHDPSQVHWEESSAIR